MLQASAVTATATASVLVLAVLLPLAASSADPQSYHSSYGGQQWVPRYNQGYYRQRWAQPRTLWQTARSIMPRFADVAYETASSLTVPALALLTLFVMWPEHKHYRSRRDAGGRSARRVPFPFIASSCLCVCASLFR